MTEQEVERIVAKGAKEALESFLLMLGVDVSKPAGVIELQKDFHHVRQERLTIGEVRSTIWHKVVGTITGSVVTLIVSAVAFYAVHGH